MADEPHKSITTVNEFIGAWKSEIDANPYSVFIAMAQYKNFQECFGIDPDRLSWALGDEEELKAYIKELFHALEAQGPIETTKRSLTTGVKLPRETIEVVGRRFQENAAKKYLRPQELTDYARAYTQYWVQALRDERLYALEKHIEQGVVRELARPEVSQNPELLGLRTGEYIKTLIHKEVEVPGAARDFVNTHRDRFAALSWQAGVVLAAAHTLVWEPTISNPDVFLGRVQERLANPDLSQPAAEVVRVAYYEVRAEEALSIKEVIEGAPSGSTAFFQSYARAAPPVLAKTADALLGLLPPPARDAVVAKIFAKSLKTFERVTQKVGERVVQSPLVQKLIQDAGSAAGQTRGARSLLATAANVAGDLAVSFRAIDKQTSEQVAAFLKTIEAHQDESVLAIVRAYAVYIERIAHSEGLHVLVEGGNWVLRRGVNKAAVGATIQEIGFLPWLRRVAVSLFNKTDIGKSVVNILGAARPVGLIAAVGRIVLRWIADALGGAWGRLKEGGVKDPPEVRASTMLIVFSLGGLLLLSFTFSSGWFGTAWGTLSTAALGGGRETGSVYTGPLPMAGDITGCPTEGGYEITQCSYWESSNTHAQYHEHAYDIATPMGTVVLATHNGNVVYAGPSSHGYGTYIKLVGVNTAGETYYTIYAHLQSVWVQSGDSVSVGQALGLSGNSGNSTSPHLHYEYRDANNQTPSSPTRFLLNTCGYSNPLGCTL